MFIRNVYRFTVPNMVQILGKPCSTWLDHCKHLIIDIGALDLTMPIKADVTV